MKYLRFVTIQDECIGNLGFVLKKNAMHNTGEFPIAGDGLLIAHDIVEHQQGLENIGTLEDEVIAYGGIIFTRGMSGEIGGYFRTAESQLAIELAGFFQYYYKHKVCNKHVPYSDNYELEFVMVRDVVQKMIKYLKENSFEEYYYPENRTDVRNYISSYAKWIRKLLQYGVYKAYKRFGSTWTAFNLFRMIQDEVNQYTPYEEGEEFLLGYSYNKVVVKRLEPEWE